MVFENLWFYLAMLPAALIAGVFAWARERRRWDRPELSRTETRE